MSFESTSRRSSIDVDNVAYLVDKLDRGLWATKVIVHEDESLREIGDIVEAFTALDFLEAAIETTGRKGNSRGAMRMVALRLLESDGASADSVEAVKRIFDPRNLKKDSDRRLLIEKGSIEHVLSAGNQPGALRIGEIGFSVLEAVVAGDTVPSRSSR